MSEWIIFGKKTPNCKRPYLCLLQMNDNLSAKWCQVLYYYSPKQLWCERDPQFFSQEERNYLSIWHRVTHYMELPEFPTDP